MGTSTGSSTGSGDEDDEGAGAENSGAAASSGRRNKFLSYRYLVDTVERMLVNVEEQDISFRQILGEAVSLKVWLLLTPRPRQCAALCVSTLV